MNYVLAHAFRWVISLIIIGVIVTFIVANVIGWLDNGSHQREPSPVYPFDLSEDYEYYENKGMDEWKESLYDEWLEAEHEQQEFLYDQWIESQHEP